MAGLPEISLTLLIAAGIIYVMNIHNWRQRQKLPPGPAGWPVIGNLLEMPISHPWLRFAEWGAKWGEFHGILPGHVIDTHQEI